MKNNVNYENNYNEYVIKKEWQRADLKISRYLNIDNILAKLKVKILTYTQLIARFFLICNSHTHGSSRKIGLSWVWFFVVVLKSSKLLKLHT